MAGMLVVHYTVPVVGQGGSVPNVASPSVIVMNINSPVNCCCIIMTIV